MVSLPFPPSHCLAGLVSELLFLACAVGEFLSPVVSSKVMGGPQSADKKSVRARGPQNWKPEVFDQTRCSRILRVEFALKNRELVKAEVFEKRVFEQTAPLK